MLVNRDGHAFRTIDRAPMDPKFITFLFLLMAKAKVNFERIMAYLYGQTTFAQTRQIALY